MGRSSSIKGAHGERELAGILGEHGYTVQRGGTQSYGERPDLYGLPGVHIEVKRREAVDLSAALKQAADDATRFNDGLPAVFHRGNRQRWRVTMDLESWLTLYGLAHSEGGDKHE